MLNLTERQTWLFLALAFCGLLAILVHKRVIVLDDGLLLDGAGPVGNRVVGNSNVMGTQSVGPAFLNANRSYMWQPSLMIAPAPSLPNITDAGSTCGAC